jgi:hypothetical protein
VNPVASLYRQVKSALNIRGVYGTFWYLYHHI